MHAILQNVGLMCRILDATCKGDSVQQWDIDSNLRYALDCLASRVLVFYPRGLSRQPSGTILNIIRTFSYMAWQEASDPWDHVYGLLNLLPESIAIVPDYTCSVEVTYEETTKRLIEWSKSLSVLSIARHTKGDSQLLTWIPDFGTASEFIALGDYDACAGVPIIISPGRKSQLPVYAKILSRVDSVGRRFSAFSLVHHDDRRLVEIRQALQEWHTLASGGLNIEAWRAQSFQTAFWKTVSVGRVKNFELRQSKVDFDTVHLEDWLHDTERHVLVDDIRELFATRPTSNGSQFLATEDRLFGVTEGRVSMGDLIALVAGSPNPLLLRPFPSEQSRYYQLVGPCYCDGKIALFHLLLVCNANLSTGIMYGEAVPPAQTDHPTSPLDYGFEEIVLV